MPAKNMRGARKTRPVSRRNADNSHVSPEPSERRVRGEAGATVDRVATPEPAAATSVDLPSRVAIRAALERFTLT